MKNLLFLLIPLFMYCNNEEKIIKEYKTQIRLMKTFADSAHVRLVKIREIYGNILIEPEDSSIRTYLLSRVDPNNREKLFIEYPMYIDVYNTCMQEANKLRLKLPQKMKDSIRISELTRDLKNIEISISDSIIRDRQKQLIKDEINELSKNINKK